MALRRCCWVVLPVLFWMVPAGGVHAAALRVQPVSDLCDGVEIADSIWASEGVPMQYWSLVSGYYYGPEKMEPAFLFPAPGIAREDSITYARLRFTCLGGNTSDTLRLQFRGLLHAEMRPFDQEFRPSQIPSTSTVVNWWLSDPWPFEGPWDPVYATGPDISPILNEILRSDAWPQQGFGNFALSIEVLDPYPGYSRMARTADSGTPWPPVMLEIYPELADAFDAPLLLGRPADSSITVSFSNLRSLDAYVAYGQEPGQYQHAQGTSRTELPDVDPLLSTPAGEVVEFDLTGLQPDEQYYGRLFYRRAGRVTYESTAEFSFHTARAAGSTFTFAITADRHLEDKVDDQLSRDIDLYKVTMQNIVADDPDFLVDLGDFAITLDSGIGVRSAQEARRIYQEERALMGGMPRPIPFYLVLGNHEGEVGWLDYMNPAGILPWSTLARKEYLPNPSPDGFYQGNAEEHPLFGLLENYYAWEWGDVLLVVLDPFRYTRTKPHHYGGAGSGDGWDWTLGSEQYNWLAEVLATSTARWKFVFIHHLTGGVLETPWGPYGRGGIEAVRYTIADRPSFEWGGEDATGEHKYWKRRPDWEHGDIHSLLVQSGVAAVFHAHDHCYVAQSLDGVVYQECPVPDQATYGVGLCALGEYEQGEWIPNSGHLRVTVSPQNVLVEYVRAYLPGDGPNGEVAASYRILEPGAVAESGAASRGPRLAPRPLPCAGTLWLDLLRPGTGPGRLTLHDASGRVVAALPVDPQTVTRGLVWNLQAPGMRRLANGVYHLRYRDDREEESHRVLVLR